MAKMTWKQVVSQREKSLSDSEIERLRQAAGQAGDMKQVRICERALDGSKKARLVCADVLADHELR